jgi:tryptophanyl-tRNA synthetase
VGLRDLRSVSKATTTAAKVALPAFKQYRERDGKFYFKLVDGNGKLLLQSAGYDSPQEAGRMIQTLQTQPQTLATLEMPAATGATAAEAISALRLLQSPPDA